MAQNRKEYMKNYRAEYWPKYYEDHSDERKVKNKQYRDLNKEKISEQNKIRAKKYRNAFFDMYGRKCACCGETRIEFLTIEHKQGREIKDELGKRAYRKATLEYRPDLYEVLCWNCNCSKGRYGYCPHELERNKFEKQLSDKIEEICK